MMANMISRRLSAGSRVFDSVDELIFSSLQARKLAGCFFACYILPMPARVKQTELKTETSLLARQGNGPLRIALAFPNTYYVGMSNLGYQAVFRLFSEHSGVRCERFFLPDAKDLSRLQRTGKPLCSLESATPLTAFHIIAFSLSFENDYPTILTMLSLGHVPLLRLQRDRRSPLVIAGGVAAFLNPEPLADFFDVFIVGEAEEVLQQFCDEALHMFAAEHTCNDPAAYKDISGIYIPSGYLLHYSEDGFLSNREALPGFPSHIVCRHISHVDRYPTVSCFLSPRTEFGDMGLLEVSRGCARHCRFCAVGSVYRPYRPRSAETILQSIDELPDLQKKIGLMGAAVSDYPHLPALIRSLTEKGCTVSVSSLRADALTDEIVGLLQRCGHKTFTIAPEAGSDRLRRAIGKNLSTLQIEAAVRVLSRCRVSGIKLYFMIGLPTEDDTDVASIIELVRRIKHVYYKEAQAEKWLNHIQVSISPFVPKPWTPFQWAAFDDVAVLKHKQKLISSGLRAERKVQVTFDLPKWGYVQALLSRGDRRVGRLLVKAHELGGDWGKVFRTCDINPDFYICRERGRDELFPWDFLEHRVTKGQLWREYQKALTDEQS
jgi:radical SAM superfamily enzyme YgiQ (UPF0313 family)